MSFFFCNKQAFSAKRLSFSAAAIALGFAASFVKLFTLPWGGSVTLCSMLFVAMAGYWYGPQTGIAAGFAYSLLQLFQDGGAYIVSPLQACLDYIFAFSALGLSGFFRHQKNGLAKGYLFAILARGLFHAIGGFLYWMDYMPESFPKSIAFLYPFAYNYSFILSEGAFSILLLSLPPIKHAVARVAALARE